MLTERGRHLPGCPYQSPPVVEDIKCVRKMSENPIWHIFHSILQGECFTQMEYMCQKCVSWQFSDSFFTECFLKMFHESFKNVLEICQNWYLWQIYDCYLNHTMTVFWHIYYFWYISEAFVNLFWQNCNRNLNLTDFWLISDTIQTVFWHIFVNDSFLTDFW